jgi:hypothetical protein
MTILFQLKPDRILDSQMNTKQQATFYHLCGNTVKFPKLSKTIKGIFQNVILERQTR